jgi:uncharacterized protein YqeY
MLAEQIQTDLKTAMKARDRQAMAALRMVLTRIREARVAEGHAGEVSDDEVQALIRREAKRRSEAASAFSAAGRDELAANEEAELAILQRYLPQQMSDDELTVIIDETIAATGASSPSDFGRVMGAVMSKVSGRADGSRVNSLVRERLS